MYALCKRQRTICKPQASPINTKDAVIATGRSSQPVLGSHGSPLVMIINSACSAGKAENTSTLGSPGESPEAVGAAMTRPRAEADSATPNVSIVWGVAARWRR